MCVGGGVFMYVRMCGWDGERRIKMLGNEEGT